MVTIIVSVIILIVSVFVHGIKMRKSKRTFSTYLRDLEFGTSVHTPYYDVLRVIATITVLFLHSENNYLTSYAEMFLGTLDYTILSILFILTYFCNILFLMISGALLIRWKDESISVFLKKRLCRVIIPFLIFAILILKLNGLIRMDLPSIKYTIKLLLAGETSISPQFWIVYVILGSYFIIPILRYAFKNMPGKFMMETYWMILVLMTCKTFMNYIGKSLDLITALISWTGVLICGFVVDSEEMLKHKKAIFILAVLSAVLLPLLYLLKPERHTPLVLGSPLTVLMASGIWLFVKTRLNKDSRIIRLLGKHSFSVLLIHWFIMFDMKLIPVKNIVFEGSMCYIGILIQVAVTFLISFVLAFIIDNTAVFLLQELWNRLTAVKINPKNHKGIS